ncbi:MAG: ABC transporter ATP-binding protein [Candidatus Methanoperedens sp.]|nr:ABC transporter ATP-binding protein [Candidatus Methanoperedens sp.]
MTDAITVENLSKIFGTSKAVNDISFQVKKGTVFGFLGPNGAGKSTTIKMLTCQLSPTSGNGYVCGFDISKKFTEIKKRIGVIFEFQNLYDELSAFENLDFFRKLHNSPKNKTDEVLQLVGMDEHKKKKVRHFSKGMKQKIMIARALINDPEILFLDEPTSGLDPHSARELRRLILNLREQGKTILLTTHNMEEADFLCDSLAFIHKGDIIAQDTPKHLKKEYGKDVVRIETIAGEIYESPMNTKDSSDIFQRLSEDKQILTICSKEATLEEVFIKLTGERWVDES